MNMNRREFLFSAGAVTMLSGCRSFEIFGAPEMKFGVVSDIHVTTPKSTRMFERALRYFRRRGVDAVMLPGDITDWGLKSGCRYVKETWDKVFAGTDVVPLFCTGNHDFDGWAYGDMTMEMHANGYSEADRCNKQGMAKAWEEIFGEPYANVRCRTVKGYSFVSGEYYGFEDLKDWLAKNGAGLKGDRPFFYFQHVPIQGTTSDSFGWSDGGKVKPLLSAYPNCIAFTGHEHRPFIDERSIWQGEFTAVATPSLSYACWPKGHENGEGPRSGRWEPDKNTGKMPTIQAMTNVPARRDLRGGQGYVVNVWSDRVAIERWDLEELECDMPDWVVPLPACRERPFDEQTRAAVAPVPEFPSGAELDFETRNTENRSGRWTIVMNCEFPTAVVPGGGRVFDYEIRAVPSDGSEPLVKRFISPAYSKLAKHEPARQRFWFDVAELPQDRDYRLEVRAFNCFGKSGAPLVSPVLHGKPGFDRSDSKL